MRLRALLLLIPLAASNAWASPSLCTKGEETLFNCSTGKKLISVCASKGWSADKGYLQYRFGRKGKVELQVPANTSTPAGKVAKYKSLMFSGGGGVVIRFNAGEFDYVVYSAIGKGWGEKEGVAVEKGGERQSHVSCKNESEGDGSAEVLEKAGLKEDPADFDLP